MADFVYNQAKGKAAEWAARVLANDPANSVIIWTLFNTTETDANLRDLDTISAIESNANSAELTGGTYARKTLTDAAGGLTVTIDDTNDRTDVDCSDQTWVALTSGGSNPTDAISGYDSDSTAGTDANIVPITQHDFGITLDGSDVTAQIAVFFRAA